MKKFVRYQSLIQVWKEEKMKNPNIIERYQSLIQVWKLWKRRDGFCLLCINLLYRYGKKEVALKAISQESINLLYRYGKGCTVTVAEIASAFGINLLYRYGKISALIKTKSESKYQSLIQVWKKQHLVVQCIVTHIYSFVNTNFSKKAGIASKLISECGLNHRKTVVKSKNPREQIVD